MVLALLTPIGGAAAQDATPEQEAALLMYEEGKEAFNAGRYDEARQRLEDARAIYEVPPIVYYLGLSYAKLDRCEDAVPLLDQVDGKLGRGHKAAEAEDARRAALQTCRSALAEGAMKRGACAEAVAWLEPVAGPTVAGMLDGAKRCEAIFATADAPGRKAAHAYLEARAALLAGQDAVAVAGARVSLEARPTDAARLLVAVASAGRVASCAQSLPLLEKPPRDAVWPGDRGRVTVALDVCRLAEARRLVQAERCRDALPLLTVLKGRTAGSDSRWRDTKERWCRPRATEFLTDTTRRKAAYKLFLAAREAVKAGDVELGRERYRKVMRLVDEPIVWREVAELALGRGDCAEASESIGQVKPDLRAVGDEATLAVCGEYATPGRVKPARLVAYRDAVAAALQAEADGDDESAHGAWTRAHGLGGHEGTSARAQALKAAATPVDSEEPPDEGVQPEPAEVVSAQPTTHIGDARPAQPAAGLHAQAAPDDVGSGSAIAGWSLVGTGAAALGVGGAFLYLWVDAGQRGRAATAVFNDTSSTNAEAWDAWHTRASARKDGETAGIVAIAGGVVGLGAVVAGVILVATGGDAEGKGSAASGEAVTVRPVIGPGHLGVAGSF